MGILMGFARGRLRFQPLFERVHRMALAGMNMGGAADHPATSGERLVIKRLPRSPVIFDVGANVGDYASMVLKVRPEAKVWSLEPSAAAFEQLQARLGERVMALPIGLSDVETDAHLYSPSAGSPLGSVYSRQHVAISFDPMERIHLRRLDDVCGERGIQTIDLLKLDVEGHELAVLRGAERLLRSGAIEAIQFEFGGSNIDSRTFLRDFVAILGESFHLYRIVRDGIRPVRYGELHEVFTTTNYLAMRRGTGVSWTG